MRSQSWLATTLLLTSLSYCSALFANVGFAISSGDGVQDITPYRLAINYDFGRIWRHHDTWGLDAYWETSFAYWEAGKVPEGAVGNDANDKLTAITTGPMFRWSRKDFIRSIEIAPYIELGVSGSYLSHHDIGGRRLSTHFQFEDKLGIGFRFGPLKEFDFAIRGVHYSNASIERPNSGVNILFISLGMWFVEHKH